MNPKSKPPLYLRIDFGCCRDNSMDGSSYFLNEVEFAGCAIFTMEGKMINKGKNIFDLWVESYYKKAKEFKSKNKQKSVKQTRRNANKRNTKRKANKKRTRRNKRRERTTERK